MYAHDRTGVIGVPEESDDGHTRLVKHEYPIRSGILMGDPLTKVVMTFCQLVTLRKVKSLLNDG